MASESDWSVDALAIFGGEPGFSDALHVGRPNNVNRERLHTRIDELLDRKWLTNDGPLVREFEQKIASRCEVDHCVAVSNGTAALEIAYRSLGLTGEVILPSFTFIATAHSAAWQGLKPVFADVSPDSFHLDPLQLEKLVTPGTSAIVGVHTWGVPCDISALTDFAQANDLRLIFDASHALGCSYGGRPIGNFGDVETISFHGTKIVNSFEGGCLLTNNPNIARQARLLRNFGFDGYDSVVSTGTNAKMDEARAAMGLTSLESLDDYIEQNRLNYETYQANLADLTGVEVYPLPQDRSVNYQYVPILIDETKAGISRDQIVEILTAENVRARRYFFPGCHRMEPYCRLDPNVGERLPNTELQTERVALLPTGTQLGTDTVEKICRLIRFLVSEATTISNRFSSENAP